MTAISFMFFIYIIYSEKFDKYYVGHSSNPYRRLEEHNNKLFNTFTSKYRPWKLAALFECGSNRGEAIIIERYIKKQKSRRLLENLIKGENIPISLAQLVRVPI